MKLEKKVLAKAASVGLLGLTLALPSVCENAGCSTVYSPIKKLVELGNDAYAMSIDVANVATKQYRTE